MARLTTLTRSVLPALLATTVVAGLAAPTGASAKGFQVPPCVLNKTCGPVGKQVYLNPKFINPGIKLYPGLKKPGPFKPHYGYGGPGWGYGAAALAGGLAVGAIAASAASASSGDACWIERRRAYDEEGNVYVRRIRVCE